MHDPMITPHIGARSSYGNDSLGLFTMTAVARSKAIEVHPLEPFLLLRVDWDSLSSNNQSHM